MESSSRGDDELHERLRQQEVVAEFGQQALATDDLDRLLADATRAVAETLDVEYAKVLELLPDGDRVALRQGIGWREGLVGSATVPTDLDSQAGYTLISEEPIIVDDLATETRFSGPELLTSHDITSGISVIIGSVEEPWGILGAHTPARRKCTRHDANFVQSVANVLATAIGNARTQRELEASNERLEQFAYAASHDLQEPLRMVSSYLQLIERRYSDTLDETGEEFLDFAVDGADRMREMIDGLLAYSRVDTQGNPLEPIVLDGVFDNAIDNLQLPIDESDAAITAEPLPHVRGDESQLEQLFQNLLSNAIEYAGTGPPRIHVGADRTDAGWQLSVRDEGIGIDPADDERVFEVFQRLHSHEEHAGTGIGLSLCRRIVERHGGDIWIESTPGEGTTVRFTLAAAHDS